MIQQDFDFEPNFIIPPDCGCGVQDTGHGFYKVCLKDKNTGIDLEIHGHSHTKHEVKAFYDGLMARTESNDLNPVSKHLANFAYWLQSKYTKLKSWYTDD